MDNYIIYISKKRTSEDRFGLHWAKIELPDYDEEKAEAKFDMLRMLLGETFILTMRINKKI